MILQFTLIVTVACLAFLSSTRAGADNGMELLTRMSMAADTLDYSGEFVYVKDGKISSMKVEHIKASGESGSRQKLMALDGSMREIIQQEDEVACILPDQGMGLREKRRAKQLFKLNISDKLESIARHYTVDHEGMARVANRNCEQVRVKPKDNYRYGYSLCIDSENQLLLSSELTDFEGSVLESYQFVGVDFGEVKQEQMNSGTPPKTLTWIDDKPENPSVNMPDSEQMWKVTANKTEFELEHYIKRISPVMQANITHLVLGDGLAQISVFVSPAKASANTTNESLSMGSLNSFTRKIDDYMITVIGEVPRETVTLIAEHTEPY